MFLDSQPYWLELTEIIEIVDLSVKVMNTAKAQSKAWVEENIGEAEDTVKQFTKGKLSLVSNIIKLCKIILIKTFFLVFKVLNVFY